MIVAHCLLVKLAPIKKPAIAKARVSFSQCVVFPVFFSVLCTRSEIWPLSGQILNWWEKMCVVSPSWLFLIGSSVRKSVFVSLFLRQHHPLAYTGKFLEITVHTLVKLSRIFEDTVGMSVWHLDQSLNYWSIKMFLGGQLKRGETWSWCLCIRATNVHVRKCHMYYIRYSLTQFKIASKIIRKWNDILNSAKVRNLMKHHLFITFSIF